MVPDLNGIIIVDERDHPVADFCFGCYGIPGREEMLNHTLNPFSKLGVEAFKY
jgi:hypothetical protein